MKAARTEGKETVMNSKGIYVILGVLVTGGAIGGVFLANRHTVAEADSAPESPRLASVERREAHVEQLQRKLRGIAEKAEMASGQAEVPSNSEDATLVMVDVAQIDESAWMQSMYDTAFVYEGPVLSKAELEKRQLEKRGVFTEATLREKEDALAVALPHMQDDIRAAREQRGADQERFEQTGESAEAKAARDGVQLEH